MGTGVRVRFRVSFLWRRNDLHRGRVGDVYNHFHFTDWAEYWPVGLAILWGLFPPSFNVVSIGLFLGFLKSGLFSYLWSDCVFSFGWALPIGLGRFSYVGSGVHARISL